MLGLTFLVVFERPSVRLPLVLFVVSCNLDIVSVLFLFSLSPPLTLRIVCHIYLVDFTMKTMRTP